jgi:hypothetical protein
VAEWVIVNKTQQYAANKRLTLARTKITGWKWRVGKRYSIQMMIKKKKKKKAEVTILTLGNTVKKKKKVYHNRPWLLYDDKGVSSPTGTTLEQLNI